MKLLGDKDAEAVFPNWEYGRWRGQYQRKWGAGDAWRWEKSCATTDPEPDSLGTGQRIGLCEKLGTC